MKFSRVSKGIDPKIVEKCEEKLSKLFLLLSLRYDQKGNDANEIGGDPLVSLLLIPYEHVLTNVIPTAATDGKRYFWNPDFLLKLTYLGTRFVGAHEAFHAYFMHPERAAGKIPKLWNIAVDYIVNGFIMEDLSKRGLKSSNEFTRHLGKFMTLKNYAELLKNPFNPPKEVKEIMGDSKEYHSSVELPDVYSEAELTEEQKKEIQRRREMNSFFFADPDLEKDMKSPEKIYSYLYSMLPKCPECGKVGVYVNPKSKQKNKNKSGGNSGGSNNDGDKDKSQSQSQSQSQSGDGGDKDDSKNQGNSKGCSHGCSTCGGAESIDIFGFGDTLDQHIDPKETKEEMAHRLAQAIDHAKRQMSSHNVGHIPGGLEDELGELIKPQIRWQDHIKAKMARIRQGGAKNDWTRFKSRPLSYHAIIPKRREYYLNFVCLLDTSGSMSNDDIVYGLSQLQSLDTKAEGWVIPADATVYYDQATQIKKCDSETLKKTKVVGRGGTCFTSFFSEYKNHFGDADFLIVITDGWLSPGELEAATNPGIPVYFIITSDHSSFHPPFGKTFKLRNGDTTAK
ncbi:MAG: VWA-like domain-containing protein [Chitinophagales bacterium]|nr:VWA-like domain-containing protein [Chitinophagales bacterium]